MFRKDLVLVALLVMTLTLMAVPLTQGIIDFLLAINISLAIILLMVAIYIKRPSDFSTFPSVILIGTAFRLALSIGTTRLILADADAGTIIETFGEFVIAGSIGIGLVIFLIITVVQFLVITKGAERIAEVGARFALDAMPGKQMSIDAEVRAGNIEADEAKDMRAALDKDSQFFGAMDGAMKFVKGDAIAGLIIICINLIGGVIVGLTVHGLTFGESVSVFSLLTIGDGLVAQFPALLMSLCAGVMVTRVNNDDAQDLGTDIVRELVRDARVPGVAAIIIFMVGLIPGFPTLIFTAIAVLLLVSSMVVRSAHRTELAAQDEKAATAEEPAPVAPHEDPHSLRYSDRFILSLTPKAADVMDLATLETSLMNRFWALFIRRGVRFPRAMIIEKGTADETASATITLDEVPLLRVVLEENCIFLSAADYALFKKSYPKVTAKEFSCKVISGYWVPDQLDPDPGTLGLPTMNFEELVTFVAFRIYEHNIGTLFSNDVMTELVESFKSVDPDTWASVEEDVGKPALLKTFRYLVEDGVPLRPPSLIVSSLHYWIHNSENPTAVILAECLRGSMRRQMCHSIAGQAGVLGMALVDPAIEKIVRKGVNDLNLISPDPANDGVYLDADVADIILDQIKALERRNKDGAYQLAIIIASDIRRRMRNFLAANDLNLPVLAQHEVATEVPSFPVEVIKLDVDRQAGSKAAKDRPVPA